MTSYSSLPTDLRQKTLLQLGVCKSKPSHVRAQPYHQHRSSRTFHFAAAIGEDGLNTAREWSAAVDESLTPDMQTTSSVDSVKTRIRTSTNVSALYFIACTSIFFLTGIVSIYSNTHSYGNACIGIERGQFNIVAQLTIGKLQRRLRLLVRTDKMMDCDKTPSIVITKQDALMSSVTANCNSDSTCVDIINVRRGQQNDLMLVNYKFGVTALDDYVSYNLGLDGEIYMCSSHKYLFDEQQMCWIDEVNADQTSITLTEYHETLNFKLEPIKDGQYLFTSTLCDVSKLTIIELPEYCNGIPAADSTCPSDEDSIVINPSTSLNARQYLGMTAASMNDVSSAQTHLTFAASGSSCSSEAGYWTFLTLCLGSSSLSSASSCSTDGATLPFMVFARKTLVFDFTHPKTNGHKVASISIANNIALDVQPLIDDLNINNEWTTATWPTIRLLIMILAAAVVYIRQEDSMEKNDRLFVSCIRLILHQTSMSNDSATKTNTKVSRAIEIEDQSQILGFLAIMSRGVVIISLGSSWWNSGLMRVVIIQSIATSVSLIHWLLTHSQYADRYKRLALGGSSAIIDVSCAIILAYSTPPIRADLDKFNTIARLLTCALIVITCPTRCFFSSACAGIIYGVESVFIALFWAIQSISIANVMIDLFAVPASIDMMRSYTGTWTAATFSIFGTLLSICGPRLTANAIAITNASVRLKTVEEQYDSDEASHDN